MTYRDKDLRKKVALYESKAGTEEEAINDSQKAKIFYKFMDSSKIKMAGFSNDKGKYIKGIEDYIPNSQYSTIKHRNKVVEDILDNCLVLSHNNKFHSIFATNSIDEAIEYYRLLKIKMPQLKITCLFDSNIDNSDNVEFKEEGLVEIIKDYNELYKQDFTIATHAAFKKDISLRLSHKEYYKWIERTPEKQINLLIVVDQMLTGFDSKWVNTLYLDNSMN